MRVLYDGWDLVYQPNSPAALHLLTLLAISPADIEAVVGLPGTCFHPLPDPLATWISPVPDHYPGKFHWEQRILPGLATKLGADLVHTFGAAALFGTKPSIISPCVYSHVKSRLAGGRRDRPGLIERLSTAFGQGGASRSAGWLWPNDLEQVKTDGRGAARQFLLPAIVHPTFQEHAGSLDAEILDQFDLQDGFVLFHGSGDQDVLHRLLAAWSWASGSIGMNHPLIALGLEPDAKQRFEQLVKEYQIGSTTRSLPHLLIPELAALYRSSSAVLYAGGENAWGGSLRLALSCAKPVVGLEDPLSDRILGPAGYLVGGRDAPVEQNRALGAGILSVIIDENLAQTLTQTAQKRFEQYVNAAGFSQRYREACLEALH